MRHNAFLTRRNPLVVVVNGLVSVVVGILFSYGGSWHTSQPWWVTVIVILFVSGFAFGILSLLSTLLPDKDE
jgi:hypothetical protein